MIFAQVQDYWPFGAGVGVFITFGALFLKWIKYILDTQDSTIKRIVVDNRVCNWRLDKVLRILLRNNIEIPEDLWGPPPWMNPRERDEWIENADGAEEERYGRPIRRSQRRPGD